MKRTINTIFVVLFACLTFVGCKTQKSSSYFKADAEAKKSELQINIGSPINTADKKELDKTWYASGKYSVIQNKENQFKDNAPFIQYLDGGKRERLWFSSSRADNRYEKAPATNFYQQIYYCEREVGEGKCPGDGWSEPVRFNLESDKSQLNNYIEGFNTASKGAVSISNNTMIFSCEQWSEKENWNSIRSQLRSLWEIDLSTLPYAYPVQITTLSGSKTWESQPSLSANGKHLLFVSNRYVNNDGLTVSTDSCGNNLNIFYSFKKDGKWSSPILVKELYSEKDEITPSISSKGNKLYFSSDKKNDFEIFEVEISFDDINGGYSLNMGTLKPFDAELIDFCSNENKNFHLNGEFNQKYPFYYYNPLNKLFPQAFLWASDNPKGMGSYDIYGCAMPFNVTLNVIVADLNPLGGNKKVDMPVIELSGAKTIVESNEKASFSLFSGLTYYLKGGSNASPANGTYACNIDPSYIHIGYSKPNLVNPLDKKYHSELISGPVVLSELTRKDGKILIAGILQDTTVNDTVYVTKAWEKKPACPGKLNIEPTYRSIAYFQTGYWEVNTTENLKRDLEKLHEGFEFASDADIYNPKGRINRNRSDYKVSGAENPAFPIKENDHLTYSIANAPWIELHPNNQYWGDRNGYENTMSQRMEGRKKRIDQYMEYARKVDENLKNLTDTIKNKYINLLSLHKDMKPKLLIEIFALSDIRDVSTIWYIGDTVSYRGAKYIGNNQFAEEKVKIVPPKIDEKTKTIVQLKPCSMGFNADGDNGSILGKSGSSDEENANLSRLRAWFGYKEVLKKLMESDVFRQYLKEGKVALPENNISYDDADIIIVTQGRGVEDEVKIPKNPYWEANFTPRNGYFDYDGVRRIEIQSRLLFEKEKKVDANYCCDPVESSN